jgi:hypothetical protein
MEHHLVPGQQFSESIRIQQVALLVFDSGRGRFAEGTAQSGDPCAVIAGEDLGQTDRR